MSVDAFADKRVKFPGSKPSATSIDLEQKRSKKNRTKHPSHDGSDELILDDIASDTSDAPRRLKAAEVCHSKNEDAVGTEVYNSEDYLKLRLQENQEFEANALSAVESLAPFRLKWVYGRLPDVNALNLTGLYKNHIAYAASNVVVIYDYVANVQQCLQGHKNTITSLAMDAEHRFFASSDSGYKSLIIIWDSLTGKALKFFPDPHDGKGCTTITFTGVDFILASIGAEEPGKQTVCLWDFDPNSQKKKPIVVGHFPHVELLRELSFDSSRPEFFTATGDKSVVFCTWVQNEKDPDSIFCYKPKKPKNFMSKYKKFCHSLWMKDGKWLVTSTMSGYLCVWTPPMVLALEDPPDPKKNIRELRRYFKLSDDGLTFFTIYRDYAVVGDEKGIVRFFDHDLKLLRWTKNFYLDSIQSIHFNLNEELPPFKKHLRDQFDGATKNYLRKENQSRVREYSMGGIKDRELSMTTLTRPPLPCADFIFSVTGGDLYYYHFRQSKIDKLVHGTPGNFVACDVCPGSNTVVFTTRKGDLQAYDFLTHKLLFNDKIFTGPHRVSTMKFHPTGFFICFGLVDGMLCFRRSFSWKTLIPPMTLTANPIMRIIFSVDGLLLTYFTNNRIIVVLKYLPKAKAWMHLGKCRTHQLDICDVQFLHDPRSKRNRLFSLGLDRLLIEYDIENCNPGDPHGLRVLKILRLEETCQPTAMVFDGPEEFGLDCITFSNTLNKLRVFQYNEERVRGTVSGPVFGRDHAINRMIEFPAQMSSTRFKKFVIFVRGNKLGIMDTPLDGNPHKYMAVFTHPGAIIDLSVVADREQIFTVGYQDNSALQWEACVRSVEATVLMGGSGITPFYHTLRRNWGGACQDVVKDIDLIFFFLNLKRVDTQADIFNITRTIRISEIPAVCRACGFYPSEYEVGLMIDEARRIKMLDQHYTDDYTTEFSFEDFIRLFSNHYYRISESEIEDAFRFLGFDEKEDPYICRSDFVYFLTSEGEKLKPYDFPIYFESMYLDQSETIFSDVQCHVKTQVMSRSSETGDDTSRSSQQDVAQGETETSSSSSSTLTGEAEEGSAEHLGSKETSDGKEGADTGQEVVDDADDDDDDDLLDGEEEDAGGEKRQKQKKTEEVELVEKEDDDDDDDDEIKDPFRKSIESEQAKRSSKDSKTTKTTEPFDGMDDDVEELMDLPERIDLSFFVGQMLPPESQQTIRWRPDFRQKRSRDLNLRPEEKERQMNRQYYDTLMKEIIDPNFPIPKKMLNALYAEYYMEHGDFDVPEELRYPGYGLSKDTWYDEEGDDELKDNASVTSARDSLLDNDTVPVRESEEELEGAKSSFGKKGKSKHKALTAEDEEEDEGEEEEEEGDEEEGNEEEAVEEMPPPIEEVDGEEFEGDDDEETLAAAVFQSFRSDEYEMPGEEDSTRYETEDGEGASVVSAPFSISEQPQSMDDSGGVSGEGRRSGIIPGYNSDNSEFVSDVENVYEEEDVAFIREVNESFRPTQEEEVEEVDKQQ